MKYYYFGSQRVAMRQGNEVYYLHGDHLGSTSLTTNVTGTVVAETRHHPFGEVRWESGSSVTDFGFTGQRNEVGFGLMDYNARYYNPLLGRFISPDKIIPDPISSQGFNRFSYVSNNPLRYIDPTGHQDCAAEDTACWEEKAYYDKRWYEAHGYREVNGKWIQSTGWNAIFADEQILYETLEEYGFVAVNGTKYWDFLELEAVAQGIVAFAIKTGQQVFDRWLPKKVPLVRMGDSVADSICKSGALACTVNSSQIIFTDRVFSDGMLVRGTTIHEIAHIIDANSGLRWNGSKWEGGLSGIFPMGKQLTQYTSDAGTRQEYFAEAVVDWVYGSRYKLTDTPRNSVNTAQKWWLSLFMGE